MLRYCTSGLLLIGFTSAAAAQDAPTPATAQIELSTAHRVYYGFRLGAGLSAYHNGEGTATLRPAASLTAGYRIGQLRSWLSTELTYQVRNNLEQGTRPSLTVPVFLRTGLGGARFHVLIGGGFTRTLKRPPAPTQFREVKRQDTFVLLGLESDYLHQERRTAALGTYLYYGLTPAVNEYSYSPGGSRYSAQQLRHIGLNVTISPYWYR